MPTPPPRRWLTQWVLEKPISKQSFILYTARGLQLAACFLASNEMWRGWLGGTLWNYFIKAIAFLKAHFILEQLVLGQTTQIESFRNTVQEEEKTGQSLKDL